MKKWKIGTLLLALGMLLSMTTVAGAEPARTQIVIWHTYTADQEETLGEIATAFNASQDAYEVLLQSQAVNGFADAVYTAVANGVGPNIIFNYASTAADYIADGLVVDLSPYVYDAEIGMADIVDSLPESIRAEATGFVDGGMYYLPAVTTGPVLFYNITIYDELQLTVPTTWEELAENSKIIYETKGIPGFACNSIADMFQALILQSGEGYIDAEKQEVLFCNETIAAWLDWFAQNVQAGYFAMNPTGDYWSSDFSAGLTASYLGSCAHDSYIEPDNFEYGVAPMISAIGETAWYPSWNRGPIVFHGSDAADRGAYEFVKFFLSPQSNTQWAISMTALSPYASTTEENPEYLEFVANEAALTAVSANLSVAGSLPSVPGSSTVRRALEEAVTVCAAGSMSGMDALAECAAIANAALRGE